MNPKQVYAAKNIIWDILVQNITNKTSRLTGLDSTALLHTNNNVLPSRIQTSKSWDQPYTDNPPSEIVSVLGTSRHDKSSHQFCTFSF